MTRTQYNALQTIHAELEKVQAHELNVNPLTMRALIARGWVETIRIGRGIYWNVTAKGWDAIPA